jgi:DNA-binding beta-propeller fold protein YncE
MTLASAIYSADMKNRMFLRRLLPSLIFLSCAFLLSHAFAQTVGKSSHRALLLVVNQGDYTMSMIDPSNGHTIGTVSTGSAQGHGHEVAASPGGRTAYVPIYGNTGVGKPGTNGKQILVLDVDSRKVVGTIDFPHGVRPHLPIFDARRHVLYVTTELNDSISIVDPYRRKIVGSAPTGQAQSHMFVLSHDGNRGYTANVGPGTVSVLDMAHRKVLTVIPISREIQRISISPDDSMVFTSDQTKPQLAVIDTATNKVKAWVPMDSTGYGTAATPDGRWLLVALPKINSVAVVDLRSLKVARTMKVCGAPQEILVRPDNPAIAYVSCASSNQVGVLNLSNWTMQKTIKAGKFPDGLAWASAQ